MACALPAFEVAPYALSGVVVGALLNHRAALEALGEAVHAAPYKAPPQAPILYVKPRNTLAGSGGRTAVPSTASGLETGASLGIVIGRAACRVHAHEAMAHVAGYTLVADISVPHETLYRPSLRGTTRGPIRHEPLGTVSFRFV